MSEVSGRVRAARLAACLIVGSVMSLSAACGGGSSPKPTVAAARPDSRLTTAQLESALLTDTDVPGTTINPEEETADVTSTQDEDKVTSGGAGCQKFIDASELATGYRATAQVGRDLLGGPTRYDLTLAAMPGTNARQVVADLRAGLAGCPGSFSVPTITMSTSELQITALGDSSFGYVLQSAMFGSTSATSYEEFVQVGSDVVHVSAYPMKLGEGDPKTLRAELAAVVKAQVTKLKSAQPKH